MDKKNIEKRTALEAKLDEKMKQASEAVEGRDVVTAKELMEEIEEIKQEIDALAEKVEEVEEDEDVETEEAPEENSTEEDVENNDKNDEGDTIMENRQILDVKCEERNAFKEYLETREIIGDNLTTESGFVVIPEDVQTDIQKIEAKRFNLEQYVRVKNVNTQAGDYPVVKLNTLEGLPTVDELEKNPALAVQALTKVPFKVETHRGFFRVSQETIDDGYDVMGELLEYIATLVTNTRNAAVLDAIKNGTQGDDGKVKKFTVKQAKSLDEIKKVLNVDLAPHYINRVAIMNQSAFHQLDTVKDENGRYLLQDDIKSASGKALLGAPVEVVSDDLLKNVAGRSPVIFGDLEEGITLFKRSEYQARWEDFMHFGQGIMTAVRQDTRIADEEAAIVVEIDLSAAPAGEGK